MRVVIQKVTRCSVEIDGKIKSSIGRGLLVLVGVEDRDTDADIEWLSNKIVNMRIFEDANNVMNLSVKDVDGEILIVSQFTLQASTKKGNRPSYIKASKHGKTVGTGEFGADMKVSLLNDGPTTIFMDSQNKE